MEFVFEWDPEKEAANVRKHGISFDEASTAFGDPFAVTVDDADHSQIETRYILLGTSGRGRLLVVAHTERGERVRIISARPASRGERKTYEQGY